MKETWYVVRYFPYAYAEIRQIIVKAKSTQEAVNKVRYDGLKDNLGNVINPYEICACYKEVRNWS